MEYNQKNRKLILGIGIIISFALLLFSLAFYFNMQHEERKDSCLNPEQVQQMSTQEIVEFMEIRQATEPTYHAFYLIPFIGFIGLLVGTIVYYIMADRIISQERTIKKNTKIILNFLSPQERKVISLLMENKGKVQQYELTHLPGLNKVKTHRILANLENKGIIHKEKLGKINKIVLNKELYDVLE